MRMIGHSHNYSFGNCKNATFIFCYAMNNNNISLMHNQDKQILIDQILDLLGTNNGGDRNSYDSLRISEDYEPNSFRYTKDELQDIQFEFMEEQQDAKKQKTHNFKKTETTPLSSRPLQSKVQQSQGNTMNYQEPPQLADKLRRKNSVKMGEVLKRNRSEKEGTDQFTKKYDNLFDEVFNQEKKKIEKEELKEKEPAKPVISMEWETKKPAPKQPIQMEWSTNKRTDDPPKIMISSEKPRESGQKQWLQQRIQSMKQEEPVRPSRVQKQAQQKRRQEQYRRQQDERRQYEQYRRQQEEQYRRQEENNRRQEEERRKAHQLKQSQNRKVQPTIQFSDSGKNYLSESMVQKMQHRHQIVKPAQQPTKPQQNITINIYDDKNTKQLSESLASDTTLNSAPSFTMLPDVISRESFEELTKRYSHKPHIIEAFKPKMQVNYGQKKQIAPVRIGFSNPMARTSPFSLSSSHAQEPTRVSPLANTQRMTPNKYEQPRVSPGKGPAVKFSYAGSAVGKSARPLSPQPQPQYQPECKHSQARSPSKLQQSTKYNSIKEEARLPVFLRRLRELTSSYPNFYSASTFTPQNVGRYNSELKEAFGECRKAISILKHTHLIYHELIKIVKELYTRMTKNIQQKSQEDKELVEYFQGQDWSSVVDFNQLEEIKPHDSFQKRVLNQLEFMTLLNSYEELLNSMDIEEVIKIGVPMTVKTYMDHREKLWAIEKNLRIMSEDFYLKAIIRIHLPQHIIDSYQIIRDGRAKSAQDRSRVLDCMTFLQEKKDVFAESWLGKKTINLLLCS